MVSEKCQMPRSKFQGILRVKIRPEIFAICSFLYPHSVSLACFVLYVMEGRFIGYFPTISETGTDHPNANFFALCMSTGGLMVMFSLFIYASYVRMSYGCSDKLFNLMRVLSVTSAIGIVGLGFCPVNIVHHRHVFFAGTGFVSILTFEAIAYAHAKAHIKPWLRWLRLVSVVIAVIGLCIFVSADWYLDHRYNVTVSTAGEYALLFFMLLGILSWRRELNAIEIHAVLL